MTSRNPTRRAGTGNPKQTTPRHLWLAALGLASMTRHRLQARLAGIDEGAGRLRGEALRLARDAGAVARGAAITLQETVAGRLSPQVSRLTAEAGSRLGALLAAFEAKPTRRLVSRPRKPAAKQATRRGAGARRKAATRVARKGRG